MPAPKKKEQTFWTRVRPFELQRIFIVFGLIYFPVAMLFLNRGRTAEMLLILYTFVLMVLGAVMVVKFILYLARTANESKGNFGSLFVVYFFNAFVPMAMYKVFGYVFVKMLPSTQAGLVCDMKHFIVDIFVLFRYQQTLETLMLGSLVLFGVFAVWSVRKHSK